MSQKDKPRQGVVASRLTLFHNGVVGSSDWLGFTLSRQLMMTSALVTVTHTRAREPAALANNMDHIIKSPPLMSRDAPVM